MTQSQTRILFAVNYGTPRIRYVNCVNFVLSCSKRARQLGLGIGKLLMQSPTVLRIEKSDP